jgi:1-acyl-sn-glycerol-3-phosphate acyltransferase
MRANRLDDRGSTPSASAAFHDEGHGYDVFGLHPPMLRRLVDLAAPVYERYFRVESTGIEHVPETGPAIVVANHSGALAIDAAMLCVDIVRRTARIPRVIADRFVPLLPAVGTLFSRAGVVTGARANVRHLLERGELVVIFPEGTTGIAKPLSRRYQLQDWRVGHAELAMRYRAPIVPAAIIGAEESWPVISRIRSLHPFGAPFLPLPLSPLPLPVQLHLRYGAPEILVGDPDDPQHVASAAHETRNTLAHLIREGRAARRRQS